MIGSRGPRRTLATVVLGLLAATIAYGPVTAQDAAASLSASFRKAAARARGPLVSIRIPDGFQPAPPFVPGRPVRMGPSPLLQPFFDPQGGGDGPKPFSGILIDPEKGFILAVLPRTLAASQLIVTFPDGRERLTTQIRRDPRSGLALLAVDVKGLQLSQVRWGDPAKLQPGDWLIALGQPGVGDPSMSVGIFSTRRRSGGEEWIETDAAITRIGAGGMLINLEGEVVGICHLGGRRADGFEGMGHAIPADRARRIAEELGRFGMVRRPYLGVELQPIGPDAAGRIEPPVGVRVVNVALGTPAAEAGIRPGDVILAIGGRPVNSTGDVQEAVESLAIGDEITVEITRQGQRREIKVKPRAMPAAPGGSRMPRPGTNFTPGLGPWQGGQVFPGTTPPPLPASPPPGTSPMPPEP